MPPRALTPIDSFFVLHSDADILLSLSVTFFERQKADASWLKAASPLLNQLYRATILLDDLIHEGWPRFAETLTVGTPEEFLEALRYFAPRFAAEVQKRRRTPTASSRRRTRMQTRCRSTPSKRRRS